MKTCSKCKQIKNESDFGPEKRSSDKLRYSCKECEKKRMRLYHLKNKDKRNAMAIERRKKNPELEKKYGLRYRTKYPWRTIIQHAKKRAAKFKWEYDLDAHLPALIERIMKMECEMTGIKLIPGVGAGSQGRRFYNTASIDRIDSLKGYTYDNIRIVCWAINCAMGTWGEDVLKQIVKKWINK